MIHDASGLSDGYAARAQMAGTKTCRGGGEGGSMGARGQGRHEVKGQHEAGGVDGTRKCA